MRTHQTQLDPAYVLGGSWQPMAYCRNVDPNLFFPEQSSVRDAQDAVAVCAGCIVKAECLEFAILGRERYGVWGGKTERQRRKIIKARGGAAQLDREVAVALSA